MTALRRSAGRLAATVPVGRRFLFAERRRAALTVTGVAAALLLILILEGIFAGAIERVTFYIRSSPADVFVSQSGVRTMHMSASVVPPDTARTAASLPGVAWAEPIGFTTGSVSGPDGDQLTYLVGYDTTSGYGGPTTIVAGRAPRLGEAVLDEQAADQLGVELGGAADVLGTRLRVVGLSTGGTSITNTTVFVSEEEFTSSLGDQASYVLVGADPGVAPETLRDRLAATVPGVTVQTRDQFAASEADIVTDMTADLLRMMSTIGLLIALAVTALGLMTATLARLRDFAVLKAVGAPLRRLVAAVATQVAWTVGLAALLAVALGLLLTWALQPVAPTVEISITAGAVTRTTLEALGVGLVAALWPLRRIAALDAATAFRESR